MAEPVHIFVLTKLVIDPNGTVVSKNIGVTFNIHDAEKYAASDVANGYETFEVESNWQEDAATTGLITAMRDFREMVKAMQDEALR
jgi:hypothetical protein